MYSGIRQAYSVSVFGKRIWRAHSVSVFGNLVSGLSMALGLLGYRSSYPAVLGMVCNIIGTVDFEYAHINTKQGGTVGSNFHTSMYNISL